MDQIWLLQLGTNGIEEVENEKRKKLELLTSRV